MTRRRPTGTLPRAYGEPDRDEDTFRLRVPPPRAPGRAPDRSRSAARSRVRRRRRDRRRAASLAVLALVVVAGAALLVGRPWQDGGGPADTAAPGSSRTAPAGGQDNASEPLEDPPPSTPPPSPTPSASASDEKDDDVRAEDIPASGPGTFTVARAGVDPKGSGSAYRVEVENGSGVDPDRAAEEIAAVLAHPRGWSHGGEQSFRQVADGPAGLVIKIATPATTDRICGKYGLRTRGEVNCRVGETVVANLKRWQLGSPQFDGPVAEYRALIVNHEVGHWLGRGHETCPGKGRPAPAMMQQIDGLKGCVANAWPYDTKGRYLSGPKEP
ncbi:DUF3152 domain-containing protein [Streptomyces sp. NPDC017520]|uniref:DUF3152 domain-containing protein n=1 Tax=Streptomyces sp. NPDC017520 TaxID=3364998 RepID=UPI003794FF36